MKKRSVILLIVLLLASLFVWVKSIDEPIAQQEVVVEEPTPTTPKPKPQPVEPPALVQQDVPFTSQAPLGNWADSRQQNGCEEASVLMAGHWALGTTFTTDEALKDILALSRKIEELTGTFEDSSTKDTARLLQEYYQVSATVESNPTLIEIKEAVWEGNVILIPADGQALHNPYFTPPGPERHMLVIIGYDSTNKEFITNDPGTRHGAGYRYNEQVLFDSIRDYSTGDHKPITTKTKSMIVVSR